MWQSIYFIRWDLLLAGLPYMLMMKGRWRFSLVYIHNIKKEENQTRTRPETTAKTIFICGGPLQRGISHNVYCNNHDGYGKNQTNGKRARCGPPSSGTSLPSTRD